MHADDVYERESVLNHAFTTKQLLRSVGSGEPNSCVLTQEAVPIYNTSVHSHTNHS